MTSPNVSLIKEVINYCSLLGFKSVFETFKDFPPWITVVVFFNRKFAVDHRQGQTINCVLRFKLDGIWFESFLVF